MKRRETEERERVKNFVFCLLYIRIMCVNFQVLEMHLVLTGQALWQNLDLDHELIQLLVRRVDAGRAVVCWLVWACQFVMGDRILWTV
jgi:hypothetical protein